MENHGQSCVAGGAYGTSHDNWRVGENTEAMEVLEKVDTLVVEKTGNMIHYRIIDPCVVGLLDDALCLLEDAVDRKS